MIQQLIRSSGLSMMKMCRLKLPANTIRRSYMTGKGSRAEQNKRLRGIMSIQELKENYSIIPLLIVLTVSCSIGISFAIRFARVSPEVNWAKRDEPWNDYRDGKAVKFFNPLGTTEKTELPDYKTK